MKPYTAHLLGAFTGFAISLFLFGPKAAFTGLIVVLVAGLVIKSITK